MDIVVNNQVKKTSDHVSLQQVVSEVLGHQQKGVAVAVNDTVIARDQWPTVLLQPNDNILIIKATQGG